MGLKRKVCQLEQKVMLSKVKLMSLQNFSVGICLGYMCVTFTVSLLCWRNLISLHMSHFKLTV